MLCKAPIKPVIAITNADMADKTFTKTFVAFIKACFFMVRPHLEAVKTALLNRKFNLGLAR